MAKQNSAARFCGSKALLGGQNTNDTCTQDPYPSIDSALFSSQPINPVNAKKSSHRMIRHMHGVLNEVYL